MSGVLSRKYKEMFTRKSAVTMEEPATTLESAEESCRQIGLEREELAEEYRRMSSRYQLQVNNLGIPTPGIGNPEIVAEVDVWWRDFTIREQAVRVRHEQAMQKVAALKYHTAGY